MDAITPTRKELDLTLDDVVDRRRHGNDWLAPGISFGGDLVIVGLLFLFFAFFAKLVQWLSVEPTARGRVCAIEQTPDGVDLIDTNGQRESVPRTALGLQVASLWEPRRLLLLRTWPRGPSGLRRTIALGTVDWVPIRGDSTVQEWEGFLGINVDPRVTMRVE